MKKFLALILVAVMMLGLVACGSKTEEPKTDPAPATDAAKPAEDTAKPAEEKPATDAAGPLDIGVLVWKYSDTYGSSVRTAIDKYAGDAGLKMEMQDGNDDQATQNNQADVMFAADKDLIVINLCDTSAGQYLVDLAKQNEVPILFYNKEPNDSEMIKGANSIFIGTKPEEAGIMQGEILADLVAANPKIDKNGDGKFQYLMFEGEVNNAEAIARTKYSVDTAVEKGLDMVNLSEIQVANWDTAKANEMMTAQIAAIGAENIEVVFCNNDDMAIGVIAALNEVGYNLGDGSGKDVVVLGVDATDTAIEYINAGKLTGTVKQDGDAMGKAIVELAANGAQGKDWLEGTSYKMADDGYSIRIPYAKITKQ